MAMTAFFRIESSSVASVLRLQSEDGSNRLTANCVRALTEQICQLRNDGRPVVIAGNQRFFSAGADLREIAALNGAKSYEFAKMGQRLMETLADFPVPVYAAISGYCMGGGLDLALACGCRIAAPNAIFGHRGAALGLITGWGGTQRLPRLIGKAKALEVLVAAEKISAEQALSYGLVHKIAQDPVEEAMHRIGCE